MQRIFWGLLFWIIFLGACSTSGASPQPASPTPSDVPFLTSAASKPTLIATERAQTEAKGSPPTTAASNPTLIATLSTPHIDQGPDGNIAVTAPEPQNCGYQWANQDLPELSGSFQKSILALQPEAQANVYAFGENCILADGTIGGFSAMETDFNVTLQVNDLTDESELGEWIVKVMQVIEDIPPDQIVGPQPGRLSMMFLSNGDQQILNFYVNQYQALPSGLSNSEIYRALKMPQ